MLRLRPRRIAGATDAALDQHWDELRLEDVAQAAWDREWRDSAWPTIDDLPPDAGGQGDDGAKETTEVYTKLDAPECVAPREQFYVWSA